MSNKGYMLIPFITQSSTSEGVLVRKYLQESANNHENAAWLRKKELCDLDFY